MDIIIDYSPYWNGDPLAAAGNRDTIMDAVYGHDVDPALCLNPPFRQIPVITPAGAAPELDRSATLMATPWPYLPDTIWMRRGGEHAYAYHTRLMIALDALDLLQSDADGAWFTIPDTIPVDDPERLDHLLDAFDGNTSDPLFDQTRHALADRARRIWPNGYPMGEQRDLSLTIARLTLSGSIALTVARLIALDGTGYDRTPLFDEAKTQYGTLMPNQLDADTLHTWFDQHRADAFTMIDQLTAAGLEPEDAPQAFRETLS